MKKGQSLGLTEPLCIMGGSAAVCTWTVVVAPSAWRPLPSWLWSAMTSEWKWNLFFLAARLPLSFVSICALSWHFCYTECKMGDGGPLFHRWKLLILEQCLALSQQKKGICRWKRWYPFMWEISCSKILRCNSYILQFIHLNWTIQWL